jgi:hypothetical protein
MEVSSGMVMKYYDCGLTYLPNEEVKNFKSLILASDIEFCNVKCCDVCG